MELKLGGCAQNHQVRLQLCRGVESLTCRREEQASSSSCNWHIVGEVGLNRLSPYAPLHSTHPSSPPRPTSSLVQAYWQISRCLTESTQAVITDTFASMTTSVLLLPPAILCNGTGFVASTVACVSPDLSHSISLVQREKRDNARWRNCRLGWCGQTPEAERGIGGPGPIRDATCSKWEHGSHGEVYDEALSLGTTRSLLVGQKGQSIKVIGMTEE